MDAVDVVVTGMYKKGELIGLAFGLGLGLGLRLGVGLGTTLPLTMLYSTGVRPGTEGVRGCSRRGSYWYVQKRQADRLGLWVRVRFRVEVRGWVRDNTTTDYI